MHTHDLSTHHHQCSNHSHGHHHHHGEGYDGHPCPTHQSDNIKVLRKIAILTTGYLIVELVGGWMSGSLALLSDAGHMFCDVCAVLLAMFAAWLSQKPHNPEKTYGYYRAEILAAFVNGLFLGLIAIGILIEAFNRFSTPHEVDAPIAMAVALGGLLVNGISAWLVSGDHHHDNVNLKAVWIHVLSDALGSVGALTAGILIYFGFTTQIDAWVSLLIVALIIFNAWGLIKKSVNILLEGVPQHLNTDEIRQALMSDERVLAIHDLHVWSIAHKQDALSVHIVLRQAEDFTADVLTQLHLLVQQRFKIFHTTIQLEPPEYDLEEHVHH